MRQHREVATATMPSPPAWTGGRVNPRGVSRGPKGAPAGLRRPAGRAPTHIAAEAARGVLGATRAGGDHHRHGRGFSAAPGPAFRRRAAPLVIAKGSALGSSLQGLTGCRAKPERIGRVGVAHATGKCALVPNISQVWSFEPARLVDLQEPAPAKAGGWGTPHCTAWIEGGFGTAHNGQGGGLKQAQAGDAQALGRQIRTLRPRPAQPPSGPAPRKPMCRQGPSPSPALAPSILLSTNPAPPDRPSRHGSWRA
jgi:hypothetical protein